MHFSSIDMTEYSTILLMIIIIILLVFMNTFWILNGE